MSGNRRPTRGPTRGQGPAPTLLDRLVGYVSPSAGLDRLRARTAMAAAGGYKGARHDRRSMKRWTPGEGSADADTLPDIPDLRGRSRDLGRNMPLATGALQTMTTHVVGVGLRPYPSIDSRTLGLDDDAASAWQKQAAAEFALWGRHADLGETMTFDALQELVFRSALESGDHLVVRRARRRPGRVYDLRLQLVEADLLSNPQRRADMPTLAGGVQTDADGRVLAYHVSDRHPGDRTGGAMRWRAIPARYADGRPICLHVIDRQRPGQTRGVPYLAPVVEALRELEGYTDAELRAAVVSALFTVFIEHEEPAGKTILDEMPRAQDGSGDIEMKPGAILDLAAGEKAVVANPGRPNPQFEPFVLAILRQIGVALELPFELLTKHFSSSYSASRAALEMAYMTFRRRRTWLVRCLCQPVWEMVIEEAVARGRLEAPGFFEDPRLRQAWLGCDWIGPARMSLDPLKDARADEVDLALGTKTLQQVCAERTGGDWELKQQQAGRERAERDRHGLGAPGMPDPGTDPQEDAT